MHGSREPGHDLEALTDLDAVAVSYADQWTGAGADHRDRLRGDLIRHCVPFADRVARRYQDWVEPLDDLQQVARLGLIKAVDHYDPDRGSFTTFAAITIRGEIKRYSPPQANATVDDDAEESTDLLDGPDESIETLPDTVTIAELIRLLPARIRQVIALRFYGDLTQAEIAAEVGISQMHVSRLLHRAMAWLRAAMLSDVVPPWTGTDDGLRVRTSQAGTTVTVVVRGEVDRDTVDRLRRHLHAAIARAAARRLVIDVTGMPMTDAAGAAVLLDACVAASLAQVTVVFTGVQPQVTSVLSTLGLPALPDA
jgi:RNA polymerase sigma factor (sigma-70 family)/anti-anti-sigma factor